MSAVGSVLANVCSTAHGVSEIPLRDAEQEAALLFDEYMRMCLPHNDCVKRSKKGTTPKKSERSSLQADGVSPFRYSDIQRDSSPSILARSYGNEPAALIQCRSPNPDAQVVQWGADFPANAAEVAEFDEEQIASDAERENRMHEAAARIACVGDELEREYGARLQGFESQLLGVIRNGADVSYEIFASTLNEIIGQDRNFAEMALVMQLGRRVISQTLTSGGATVSYFRQFVCDAFSNALAVQGGVSNFVEDSQPPAEDKSPR